MTFLVNILVFILLKCKGHLEHKNICQKKTTTSKVEFVGSVTIALESEIYVLVKMGLMVPSGCAYVFLTIGDDFFF